MIESQGIVVSRISVRRGNGEPLHDQMLSAARDSVASSSDIGGVIAATFSNPDRFPALAVRIAGDLGLSPSIPAFDVQLACSAYPYSIYLAGNIAQATGKPVLVLDGDVQSPLVDSTDHATGNIFSDAATASIVTADSGFRTRFSFLSKYDEALTCTANGPIRMDGFKVFSFVATEVSSMLREFGDGFDFFAPHQANPYMIRQLSRSLALESKLLTIDAKTLNPGSCSVAMSLKTAPRAGTALIAGFGAGYSASAGIVRYEL